MNSRAHSGLKKSAPDFFKPFCSGKAIARWAAPVAFLLLLSFAGCQKGKSPAPAAGKKGPAVNRPLPAQGVVMVVGNEQVTEQEFNEEFLRRHPGGTPYAPGTPGHRMMAQQVLRDIAIGHMLVLEARRQGLKVSKAELDQDINTITAQVGGPEQLKNALQMRGKTLKDLRLSREKTMLANRLFAEYSKKHQKPQTEKEMRAYHAAHPQEFIFPERVHAAHILLRCEGKTQCLAQGLALRNRLLKKEISFEDAARTLSQDPGSAARGGDLGYFPRGQMVPPFEQAAFALEKNEISPPVQSQFGVHLIKLIDKKPKGPATFEEARPMLEQRQQQGGFQKAKDELNALLERTYKPDIAPRHKALFPDGNIFAPINADPPVFQPPVVSGSGTAPAGKP